MAKKKTQRRQTSADRWANQAAAQALLKYGPEESGLQELAQQAQDTYGVTVKQAKGTGQSTISAIDATRPQVAGLYDKAGLDQAKTAQTLIGQDLAGLGGVANSIKAGAASEQAVQLGNLRTAQTAALTDLATRRVAARSGVQFATNNAQSQLASDLGKVATRKQQLEGEKGTFQAVTAQQLSDAAQEQAQTVALAQARLDQSDANSRRSTEQSERNSQRSAGIDPNTGAIISGGKLDPKRPAASRSGGRSNLQPSGAQSRAASTIQTISNQAHNLYAKNPQKYSRAKLVQALSASTPAMTVDPKSGKPVASNAPGAVKLAARKGHAPDILMTAALDQAMFGYLSPNTQKKLQAQGYSIDALGVTSYGSRPRGVSAASNDNERRVQSALGQFDAAVRGASAPATRTRTVTTLTGSPGTRNVRLSTGGAVAIPVGAKGFRHKGELWVVGRDGVARPQRARLAG